MASRSQIARSLAYLSEAYRTDMPTDLTVGVWDDQLGTVSDGELSAAVRDHVSESQYHPKPAEIIQRVQEARAGKRLMEFSDEAKANAASDDEQTRYRCLDCRDTGITPIYHPGFTRSVRVFDSVRERWEAYDEEARNNPDILNLEHEKWRANAVRQGPHVSLAKTCLCDCAAGNRKREHRSEQEEKVERGKATTRLLENVINLDRRRACVARLRTVQEVLDWIEAGPAAPAEWNADDWNNDVEWT